MKNPGFTLVEILVSICVSVSIIGAVLSIFITTHTSQKRILSSYELLNQSGYSMELMSRSLRMAEKESGQGCLSSLGLNYEIPSAFRIGGDEGLGTGIKFINHLEEDDCQEFFLENNQLKYRKGIGTTNEETVNLTSSKLEITNFKFKLQGHNQDDNYQSRVTMLLIVQTSPEGPKITLETTISQRNIDTYQLY